MKRLLKILTLLALPSFAAAQCDTTGILLELQATTNLQGLILANDRCLTSATVLYPLVVSNDTLYFSGSSGTANNGVSDNEDSGKFRLGNRYMGTPDAPFTMDRKINVDGHLLHIGDGTDSLLFVVNGTTDKVGVKTVTPARDFSVQGEVRISDLTTDTPDRIVGADGDGDIARVYLSGLTMSGGVLRAVDSLTTNEIQTYSHASAANLYTNTLSIGGGTWSIAGAGINTVTSTAGAITITATEAQTANNGLSDREAGGGIFRWGDRYMNLPDGPFTTDRKQNISAFKAYIGDNTDSTLLVVDGTNDFVGIGVTPLGKLHVKGLGTSTGIGFEVDNSDGSILTKLRDNGQFDMVKSGTQIFKITPGSSGLDGQVAIGRNAFCSNIGSMALGTYSEASAIYATAVGPEAIATQQEAFAIGRYSLSRAVQAFTFGHFQDNQFANSFLLGNGQDANSGSLLTGLYAASIGFGARARVPQFVIRGLELSTHAWTAAGNTVTSTGHGLTAGEPIILYNGSVSSYHTVSSVTNANVFVVSGSAPGASGTNFRTYPGNILEYTNGTDGSKLMVMDRFGFLGVGNSAPTQKLHVTGNARVTGAYYDSNNDPGTASQVLSSTATGTDWVAAPTAPTILTANNVLTLTGTNLQWGGSQVQNTTNDQDGFWQLHKDGRKEFFRYNTGNPFTDVNVTATVDITGKAADPSINPTPSEDNILTLRGHNGTSTYYANAMFFGTYTTAAYGSWIQTRSESAYTTYYPLNLNVNGGKVGIGRDPNTDQLDAHVTISRSLSGSTITGILMHIENTEGNKTAMSWGHGYDNIDGEMGYFDTEGIFRMTNRNTGTGETIRFAIGGETTDRAVMLPSTAASNVRFGVGFNNTTDLTSTLLSKGSLGAAALSTSGAPTFDETKFFVVYTAAGAQTYTLPAQTDCKGRIFWIQNNSSAGTITLSVAVKKANGATFNTLAPGEFCQFISDGADFWGYKQTSL